MCPKSPGEGCVTVACAMQVDFSRLLGDLRLLVERLGKLAAHFRQAEGDLCACIRPRSARLKIMEFDEAEPEGATEPLQLARREAQQNRQPTAEESKPFPHAQGAPGPRKAAR